MRVRVHGPRIVLVAECTLNFSKVSYVLGSHLTVKILHRSTGILQCSHSSNHLCAATMFSKLWTNFWILVTSSDHDRDGPVGRLSFPSEYAADHRRLLGFTLLVLLLGHFWSLPGTYGSKLTGASSNKRRIAGTNGGKPLSEWDDIFQQRTDDDWRVLWHKEKHRRCQHQLLSHMELVCEKDIYKLARRKRKKRDISGGGGSDGAYFGALEDTTNSDPLEDADGTQADTETGKTPE